MESWDSELSESGLTSEIRRLGQKLWPFMSGPDFRMLPKMVNGTQHARIHAVAVQLQRKFASRLSNECVSNPQKELG